MVQWVKTLATQGCKPGSLNAFPESYVKVEAENHCPELSSDFHVCAVAGPLTPRKINKSTKTNVWKRTKSLVGNGLYNAFRKGECRMVCLGHRKRTLVDPKIRL